MLSGNKTYDNRNLRDRQKVFNDGIVTIYTTNEREVVSEKCKFRFSRESVSMQTYTNADQNATTAITAIGVQAGGPTVEAGDIALIDDEYYMVTHAQYKNYEHPAWYKVYLERSTMPYEIV